MDERLDGLGHSIARSFWPAVRIAALAWQKRPAALFFRCIFSEGGGHTLVHLRYSIHAPLEAIVMERQLPPEKRRGRAAPLPWRAPLTHLTCSCRAALTPPTDWPTISLRTVQ